ncbi:MAG: hypothetical protein PsegKO_35500 [Pseudohongiellaceae bacterium]|jgi:hypothetical protein
MLTRYFPPAFLLINGLLYCVLAWLFVADPISWFSNLSIELRDPVGYTELKTMYIGLMGSLGIFSLLGVVVERWRQAALVLALVSYVLLALVRSMGIFIEGQGNDFMLQLLAAEVVSAVLAAVGLVCLARQR